MKRLLALTALFTVVTAAAAYAACSSPAGVAGQFFYASNMNSMVFCDGTNWVSMSGGANVSVGGTVNSPAGNDGELQFKSGTGFGSSSGLTWTTGTNTLNAINVAGTTATFTNLGGILTTANQPNITGLGTITDLRASSATISMVYASTVSASTGIFSNLAGTLGTATQPNITSVGTLTGLAVSGTISTTALYVNGVAITGSGSGDQITSGTATVQANQSTGYISLSTGVTTWGYLGSSATYLPNLNIGGNISTTTISTNAVQIISQTVPATCAATNAGTLRYNSSTTTLELCTGSGWVPMGVGVPAGTIAAFASTTCPTGWSEYTAARGRFLRGIDNGAGNDPSGIRAPGDTQADAFQGHWLQIIGQRGNAGNVYNGVGRNDNYSGIGAALTSELRASDPISDGVNGTPRTSSETRPKNVAVTFCVFNGTSNGWNNPLSGGGTATPAGSTADVQYNSGGALAADTGLFTYSAGVLKAPTVSTTNISATTATVTSLGTANIAASGNVRAATISATTGIQVGNVASTCASGISGTIRYNTTSNTMEYCNGTAWANLGPSATTPVAFTAYLSSGVQNVTAASWAKVALDTIVFDTNNNFSTGNSRFTPTIPGKYFLTGAVVCGAGTGFCSAAIYKNGSKIAQGSSYVTSASANAVVSYILDMNGSTDYIELYGFSAGGTFLNGSYATYLSGVILSPQGGAGGGTATPAGSTADVQYNSGGALAADTGLFTYSAGVLKAPTVSTTNISATTATVTSLGTANIAASGNVRAATISATTGIQVGNVASTCASGISGTIRYNTTSNTMEYCNGTAWANLGPSATTPVSFLVNKNGTSQSVTSGAWTKLTWSTKSFDTNNNFANDRFTPTVPGKYLFYANAYCGIGDCYLAIAKNGTNASTTGLTSSNPSRAGTTIILDMNGTTDYVEVNVYATTTTINGNVADTYFTGTLLAPQGGAGGGTATPAGSTADVQYNSGGALAADTGNFTYASGVLKAPTVSATTIKAGGTVQVGGDGTETCASAADYGKNRRNPTSGRMQVCR